MKVCTDSCLFGAWISDRYKGKLFENVLDIGTGTGLLSLMFAQKNSSKIDAIEMDQDAYQQAIDNANNSPWKNKINIIHKSLQEFDPEHKYDFIFSNPPFFEGDLISANEQKNKAKHHTSLTLRELILFSSHYLKSDGEVALLIPYHRLEHLKLLLNEYGFHINQLALVKQTDKHGYFRAMVFFSGKEYNEYVNNEIVIKDSNGNYTADFIDLLKEYYLHL